MKTTKVYWKELETKRGIFFQAGLIVSLTLVFMAFAWKSSHRSVKDIGPSNITYIDTDIIPRTEPKKPEPPQLQPSQIEIVDNNHEVEEIALAQVEGSQTTAVAPWEPVILIKEEVAVTEDVPFIFTEIMPEFPGGERALYRYLSRELVYPNVAKQTGIQGTVFLSFIVEPDGSITNINVLRGIGGGCDEEAVRVIAAMPKWKPGVQAGRAVRVQFSLRVVFSLK